MNAQQTKIIGKLVADSAMEFLASKHGLSVGEIAGLLLGGHRQLCEQFAKLAEVGTKEARAFYGI